MISFRILIYFRIKIVYKRILNQLNNQNKKIKLKWLKIQNKYAKAYLLFIKKIKITFI
jgi:F0F1-type ATP synthase membrane subunit b/b'